MPDMMAKRTGSRDDILVLVAGSSYSLQEEEERGLTQTLISTPVTADLGGQLFRDIMAWKSLPVNPLHVSVLEVQDWDKTAQTYSLLVQETQKQLSKTLMRKYSSILDSVFILIVSLDQYISRRLLIVARLIIEIFKYPRRTSTLLVSKQGVDVIKEGSDLLGVDLSGSNLRGANLRRSNLRNANLEGADLSYANIREANLFEANLKYANLKGADLTGADLSFANLLGANLQNADLSRARLIRADLEKADLSGANLKSANLCDANLKDTRLPKAE
jgi:hypothetical protein